MRFNENATPAEREAMEHYWKNEIHPDLRTILVSGDRFCEQNGLPEQVMTDGKRDPKGQVRIYVTYWRKLLRSLLPGEHQGKIDPEGDGTFRALNTEDLKQLAKLTKAINERVGKEEAAQKRCLGQAERDAFVTLLLEELAAKKFTWHWVLCACDLRTRHYKPPQLLMLNDFYGVRCKQPQWEHLVHDVTAPHRHLARRDFAWRAKYAPKTHQLT